MTHTAKHTPGPWNVEKNRAPNGGIYYRVYDQESATNCIAQIIGDGRIEYHENAHLIAAAPAMYEALKELREHSETVLRDIGLPHDDAMLMLALIDNATRALAQAEGSAK